MTLRTFKRSVSWICLPNGSASFFPLTFSPPSGNRPVRLGRETALPETRLAGLPSSGRKKKTEAPGRSRREEGSGLLGFYDVTADLAIAPFLDALDNMAGWGGGSEAVRSKKQGKAS